MITWSYLAGFFDGEGCIYYRLGKPNLKVTLTQSKERGRVLLSDIQNFLAASGIRSTLEQRKNTEYHLLVLCGKDNVTRFLNSLLPYLHIKKVEAQDLLRYFKTYPKIDLGIGWSYART